jgi:hypothetical protein
MEMCSDFGDRASDDIHVEDEVHNVGSRPTGAVGTSKSAAEIEPMSHA